jgi:hypothetical protein
VAVESRGIVAEGKPEGKSGWGRTVAIQLLILIVSLGAAEVILRVIDLRYLRAHRVGADRIYNYDAELGWFPVPNSDVSFTGIRTIRVRHNSLGFRDIEHDTAGTRSSGATTSSRTSASPKFCARSCPSSASSMPA